MAGRHHESKRDSADVTPPKEHFIRVLKDASDGSTPRPSSRASDRQQQRFNSKEKLLSPSTPRLGHHHSDQSLGDSESTHAPRKKDLNTRMVTLMERMVTVTIEQDSVIRKLRSELDEMKEKLQLAGGRRVEELEGKKKEAEDEHKINARSLDLDLQKLKVSKTDADKEAIRLREQVESLEETMKKLRKEVRKD